MVSAATTSIVQVSRIAEVGSLDPEAIVTPGIFVDRLVEVANPRQEEALLREAAEQ
jgi:3-oxoadipate CoA-transferase alpha subunit